eukprot:CAMPEP_0179370218 /NCGR_PEP_ID=MMETSP0797-20121207/85053_1 /TAXON_ID=47934 /ORGANISM="Dinophysis acuminata, Strain DAEP01" /LENGTH=45 /DNA_ID= /DNA_START= /DNA_END= /DNA_ORIENTATION=
MATALAADAFTEGAEANDAADTTLGFTGATLHNSTSASPTRAAPT